MIPIFYPIKCNTGHPFSLSMYSEWMVHINCYCLLLIDYLIYYSRFTEEVSFNASLTSKSKSADPKK